VIWIPRIATALRARQGPSAASGGALRAALTRAHAVAAMQLCDEGGPSSHADEVIYRTRFLLDGGVQIPMLGWRCAPFACSARSTLATDDLRRRILNKQPPSRLTVRGDSYPPVGECELPTLIVTSEFDPQTHRSNGPIVQRSLKNSQLADVPGAAHSGAFDHDCTRTMVRDFLNAPFEKRDMSCLRTIPPLKFVTDVKAILR
jgi:hypothetical protein